jgi:RHS repeat-associated protein
MNYTNPDGNADFLGGITRVPRLDTATRSALTAQGVDVNHIDPAGTTATPTTTGGHKIATFGPIGGTARTFGYAGSLVSDDGKYAYSWNEKEQLVAVTQKPATTASPIRRIRYYYDGRGRVVGRRAQSATVVSLSDNLDTLQWQTETNPSILASDGLPADTTFAWDMVSDQLIAVFNTNPLQSDANAGLMRQIIHGGLTYDDPIEVTMLAGDISGKLNRLYPLFDEAAAGSLQAVLNADAQLVARNLPDDPAGAEDVSFAGATIDRASIHATKDSSGNLQSIDVTLHATEPLDPATLAAGLRLASVNTNGVAVKTFAGTAQAVSGDAYSAKFTLSPTEWSTLNDPAAQALSIGVTPTLRAQGWASGLPILPPTEWARLNGIFTSPTLPVEIRDSLSSISTFVAAIGNSSQNTTTIYNVPSIALVGSAGSGADATSTLFTAKFQALPFSDPATGLVYARARWYSPETGTFLSGDPLAYKDSSNLYTFCGGDPVNCSDPTGLAGFTDGSSALQLAEEAARWTPRVIIGGKAAVEVAAAGGGKIIASAAAPVAVGLGGGLLANWVINRWADLTDLHADEYAAQRRLEETRMMAAQRQKHRAPQLPRLPGVTPYSQQIQANPALASQLTAYHNEAVRDAAGRPTAVREADKLVLHPFVRGATHITTTASIAAHVGSSAYGAPTGLYVSPTDQIDALLARGASRTEIEIALGLEPGSLSRGDLVRIDIPDPFARNLRMPDPATGNRLHRPGTGRTLGGIPESVIDSPLKTDPRIHVTKVPGL